MTALLSVFNLWLPEQALSEFVQIFYLRGIDVIVYDKGR